MAGKTRTFVASYPGLRCQETTLVLSEFHVTKSKLKGEIGENARRGIMAAFKQAYRDQHGYVIKMWLEFDELKLEETEDSVTQLTGCDCECSTCDSGQGWHCHKSNRGCYE